MNRSFPLFLLLALGLLAACQGPVERDVLAPAASGSVGPPPLDTLNLPGDCAPGKYPRLVLCPNEVAVARSRLKTWPYEGMYARIKGEAARSLATPGKTYDQNVESKNARVAKYAAIVALMEQDAAMADKAIAAILRLQSNWEFGLGLGSTDLFIRIVGPLQEALEGFDLVMGGGFADAGERAAMEKALGAIAKKLFEMWIEGPGHMLVKFCQNNYNTKLSTTLGLAALMLDSHPDRARWLRFAATESNRFYGDGVSDRNVYLSAEGVCKEPPGYFNFGGRATMAFALLYHYLVGRGQTYQNDCSVGDNACTEGQVTVDGLLASRRLLRSHHWMAKIQLPDGLRPSIDEGRTTDSPDGGPLWHYARGDTLTLWDYLRSHPGSEVYNTGWAGYYLGRVDFSRAPRVTDLAPTQAFEASGQVIMRSGWDPDAVYVAVLGESGLMRSQVHNHADATSFQLFAHGEMLALDTGYFEPPTGDSYENRAKTAGPEAHNLILVDGKGAPSPSLSAKGGVDATLSNTIDSEGLDYTEVKTSYQGVSFQRGVLFAHERYLVVADALSADAAHSYSWRLHGFGGGSSIRKNYEVGSFALQGGLPTWTRKKAKLRLVLDSSAGRPTFNTALFPHEWKSSWEGYHNVVDGVQKSSAAQPNLAFLAVVMPRRASEAFPRMEVHELADGVACLTVRGEGYYDLALARPPGASGTVTVTAPGFAPLSTDASFAWLSVGPSGAVKRALIRGGSTLRFAEATLIKSDAGKTPALYPVSPPKAP